MTEYMSLLALCATCGRPFTSNPSLVPSVNNNPICRTCIDAANPIREANGLPPLVYHPDAYEAEEIG